MSDTIRLTPTDFATLRRLEEAEGVDAELRDALDDLWDRVDRALQRATDELDGDWTVRLWPWEQGSEHFPFLWARCKLDGHREFAAHLGGFLSPDHVNLCLDLEKDALDDGSAAETLDQVHEFWRGPVARLLRDVEDTRLQVWTDPDNVMAPEIYVERGFDELMATNEDAEHPWPRVGYLPSAHALLEADDLAGLLADRLRTLEPFYRAQVAFCRG